MTELYTKNSKDFIEDRVAYAGVRPNSSISQPLSKGIEIDVGRLQDKLQVISGRLSIVETTTIIFTVLVSLMMVVTLLFIQYNNGQLLEATNNYKVKTSDIQKQSNLMTESITQQFNYDKIKQTATDNQMAVDKSRIRTVGE